MDSQASGSRVLGSVCVCVCSHQMFAVVLGLGRFEVCAPCASLSRGWWVSHDLRGLGGGNGTKSCQRII